jgi:hypothetical protein
MPVQPTLYLVFAVCYTARVIFQALQANPHVVGQLIVTRIHQLGLEANTIP